MIILLGLISFEILYEAGYDTLVHICAIIGAILSIPGGILGTVFDGIMNFSIAGLMSSKIKDLIGTSFGQFIVNAIRSFFIPFILTAVVVLIIS